MPQHNINDNIWENETSTWKSNKNTLYFAPFQKYCNTELPEHQRFLITDIINANQTSVLYCNTNTDAQLCIDFLRDHQISGSRKPNSMNALELKGINTKTFSKILEKISGDQDKKTKILVVTGRKTLLAETREKFKPFFLEHGIVNVELYRDYLLPHNNLKWAFADEAAYEKYVEKLTGLFKRHPNKKELIIFNPKEKTIETVAYQNSGEKVSREHTEKTKALRKFNAAHDYRNSGGEISNEAIQELNLQTLYSLSPSVFLEHRGFLPEKLSETLARGPIKTFDCPRAPAISVNALPYVPSTSSALQKPPVAIPVMFNPIKEIPEGDYHFTPAALPTSSAP